MMDISAKFPTKESSQTLYEARNGVGQGCILHQTLFLLILDRVMKRVKGLRKSGIQWSKKERLEDLDYVDDICLLAQRF